MKITCILNVAYTTNKKKRNLKNKKLKRVSSLFKFHCIGSSDDGRLFPSFILQTNLKPYCVLDNEG